MTIPRSPCLIGVGTRTWHPDDVGDGRRARAARDVGGGRAAPRPRTPGVGRRGARPARRDRRRLHPDLAVRRPRRPARASGSGVEPEAPALLGHRRHDARSCWSRTWPSRSCAASSTSRSSSAPRRSRPSGGSRSGGERYPYSFKPEEKRPFPWEAPFHPAEVAHEVFQAWLTFAIFDNARRGHLGVGPRRVPRRSSVSSGRGSRRSRPRTRRRGSRSSGRPRRSSRPSPANRMVGYPYTKYMVSIMDVDMAAALVLASHEAADALGVPADRRVYLRGWCYATDPGLRRRARRPVAVAGDGARGAAPRSASAGVGIDDVAHLDLYSCFGSSVNFARDALGIASRRSAAAHRHRRPAVPRRRGERLPDPLDRDDGAGAAGGPRLARAGQRRRDAHDQARLRRATRPSPAPPRRPPPGPSPEQPTVAIRDTYAGPGDRRRLLGRARPRRRARVGGRGLRRRRAASARTRRCRTPICWRRPRGRARRPHAHADDATRTSTPQRCSGETDGGRRDRVRSALGRLLRRPYDTYRRLRDEAPVLLQRAVRVLGAVALRRRRGRPPGLADVHEHEGHHPRPARATRTSASLATGSIIFMDPPDHERLRRLVSRVFTPKAVADLEPMVRSLITKYLDPLVGEPAFDLTADFAGPFPVEVICEILGVPEGDRQQIRHWVDEMLHREPGRPEADAGGHGSGAEHDHLRAGAGAGEAPEPDAGHALRAGGGRPLGRGDRRVRRARGRARAARR